MKNARILPLSAPLLLTFVGIAVLNPAATAQTPPIELNGQSLWFLESPEGDLLEFFDAATGEERDEAGDADAFTYVYSVTGSDTAALTVTFNPGKFDEWDLTFDNSGGGTFVRREFKDSVLEDTDTGSFSHDGDPNGPPADLIGLTITEEENEAPERFDFMTDTKGREFEPGDADPFTYTYQVTGADTAAVVATFKPGTKWDELDLTFTTDTEGTYIRRRFDEGELKDTKSGDFSMIVNTNTVDMTVGKNSGNQKGDDIYNASGNRQKLRIRTRGMRTSKALAKTSNDGESDRMELRGSRGNRFLKITYFQIGGGKKNVTAQVIKGSAKTSQLDHEDSSKLIIAAKPKKRPKNHRIKVSAKSSSTAGAKDAVVVDLKAGR